MRILLVTRDFPPHASAGTEVYTLSLALGLRQLGHDINVVCVGRWNEDPTYFNGVTEDIHRGINVSRLHLNWLRAPDPNRYLYNNPLVAAFMKDYVSEFNPDVVHVTSCDRISASVIPTLKRMGVPVVLSLTDFWFICPLFNLVRFDNATCNGQTTPWECLRCTTHGTKVYRGLSRLFPARMVQFILTRISHHPTLTRQRGLRGMAFDMQDRKDYMLSALRQADHVMIATPFGRELFRAIVPDKDIHYVPYGHNLHWLKYYRGKTPTRTLRIAYVGRLDESKGAHLLLEAFRQLPGNTNVELEIYGNMPANSYRERLRTLAGNDRRIHFLGGYAHEDSARVYANIDVLVIPSLWYDFPLVAYEALATGTIVIATDLPGLNETIEPNVNGLLFPRGDVVALAQQLTRLVEDPDLFDRLRRQTTKVKTIAEATRELESLYQLLGNAS